MSQTARVTSIGAIKEFRGSLVRFGEDVRGALGAVDMEIRRTLDWLTHDRPLYWQAEIKRRKEQVSLAQAEVFKRKIQGGPGREVHDTEQKELLRVAKRRLAEAEAKLDVVRKWAPQFQQAVFEYQSRARPTGDMLDRDLRAAVALLDRMTAALDAYIATAPPSAPAGGLVGGRAASGPESAGGASAAMPDTPGPDRAEPSPPMTEATAPAGADAPADGPSAAGPTGPPE